MTTQARTTSFHRWDPAQFWVLARKQRANDAGRQRRHSGLEIQARTPGVVRTVDLAIIIVLGIAAVRIDGGHARSLQEVDWLEIVLAAIVFVNYLAFGSAYRFKALSNLKAQAIGISLAWACAIVTLFAISLAGVSRDGLLHPRWMAPWMPMAWVALLGWRTVVAWWIEYHQRRGHWAIRIAVVGDGTPALDLVHRLRAIGGNIDIVGVFVARSCALQAQRTVDDLYQLANSQGIDQILIALPWLSPVELNAAVRKLCMLPVEVKIYAGMPRAGDVSNEIKSAGSLPTLAIQNQPLVGWGGPLKRAEDIILAGILLCVLGPLFLFIAMLIKLDSAGPILFRQERFGFNNNSIWVCKFRTMYHAPDPDPAIPQARRDDPRVTRLGAFLRRTSLDELPQLFNVLGGSMSLIGPRPHATVHNKKYGRLIDGYLGRHRMKPGITGWAQVNGHRGETDTIDKMRLRLRHDLYYIDNWSLFLDLKVLALTIPAVVHAKNAY